MDTTIELDREHDQLYMLFRPDAGTRRSVAKTVRLSDDVVADLDAEGRLVGLDVEQASRVLGRADIDRLSVAVAMTSSRKTEP